MRRARAFERVFIFLLVMATVAVVVSFWSKSQVSQTGVGGPDEEEIVDKEPLTNENSAPDASLLQAYTSDDLGFSMSVLKGAVRESGSGAVKTLYFDDNVLSVVPKEQLSMIESSFSVTSEEKVQAAGQDARKITARSQKDGAELRVLILTKDDRVYYFQGTELFIENVIKSFQWKNADTVIE